jgi:hypothetical protein
MEGATRALASPQNIFPKSSQRYEVYFDGNPGAGAGRNQTVSRGECINLILPDMLLTCSYRLGFAELPTLNSSALQKIHTHPKL